jgi:hypothetical protein
LEWLAIVSNAYIIKARWINMFHDFNFNIVHCVRFKYPNIDALNKNPMGCAKEEEDFRRRYKTMNGCNIFKK